MPINIEIDRFLLLFAEPWNRFEVLWQNICVIRNEKENDAKPIKHQINSYRLLNDSIEIMFVCSIFFFSCFGLIMLIFFTYLIRCFSFFISFINLSFYCSRLNEQKKNYFFFYFVELNQHEMGNTMF